MALISPSVLRLQFKFTVVSGIILRIHYLFANIQWIHDLFREFTMKLFFFSNSLWIYYLFFQLTMNSLPISKDIFVFMANGPYKSKHERSKIAWFAFSCWLSFSLDIWLASRDQQNSRFIILANQVLEEKSSIIFTNSR